MSDKKKKKKVRELPKLPKYIIPLPNADKTWHETWDFPPNRDLLNFIHPFRAVLFATPNSGKTTTIKNIILRADPPFENVIICHADAKNSKDYIDLGPNIKMISEIPTPEQWGQNRVKTLCIMDDLDQKSLSKQQKMCLSRAFGYCSTHCNLSLCLTQQCAFECLPIVRRCSNIMIFWDQLDKDSLSRMSSKAGLKASNLRTIFSTICTKPRDSLWIDMTNGSPAPLRRNGYDVIEQTDGKKSEKAKMNDDNFKVRVA